MTKRYFGTDGIRGKVGEAPMTPDFALQLGWAAGRVFAPEGGNGKARARVVIGKDTRLSGYLLESALEAGFSAAGVDVLLVGPMPTPAIAYLTQTFRACAGVVISASHNPFDDNGIKFFRADGHKLDDALEAEIEAGLEAPLTCVPSAELGRATRIESAAARYIEYCKSTYRSDGASLSGLTLAVDCANGAAYHIAPHVFRELGATVHSIGTAPDGLNINRDCGSTAPAALQALVTETRSDAGIALDGDGDRCIMVDAGGAIVDGDQLLYAIARARQDGDALHGPVVGTQMSNLGLEQALEVAGIAFERAKVGDRHVFERLLATGGMLGGEASGHILCLDRSGAGDGIISALQVLAAMTSANADLQTLVAPVSKCPQILINVPVAGGAAESLMAADSVTRAVGDVERELNGQGRVLLRPSGTEPLIRVMVEGHDDQLIRASAERIAEAVRAGD